MSLVQRLKTGPCLPWEAVDTLGAVPKGAGSAANASRCARARVARRSPLLPPPPRPTPSLNPPPPPPPLVHRCLQR